MPGADDCIALDIATGQAVAVMGAVVFNGVVAAIYIKYSN